MKIVNIRFVYGCFISLLFIMFGMYMFPNVFQMIVLNKDFQPENIVVGSVIFGVALLICTVLFVRNEQEKKWSYQKVTFSVLKLVLVYLVYVLLLSMFSGLLATCVYYVLKGVLEFNQIKGIINWFISVMCFLLLPVLINFFWKYIQNCQNLIASIKNVLKLNLKTYYLLVIVVVVFYGCGVLITTIFNFLPSGNLYTIFQMMLYAIAGGIGFSIMGNICEKGER